MTDLQSTIPSIPSNEFIIASLEQPFRDGVTSTNRQITVREPLRLSFFNRHIILEISLLGGPPAYHAGPPGYSEPPPNEDWARTPTLRFAYDGEKLISLYGSTCYHGVGEVLSAEAGSIDKADPKELAAFFSYLAVAGWHQTIVGGSGDSVPTVPNPVITGTASDGWEVHFWAMRHFGGCIPQTPNLFEYTITITPDFHVTLDEREYGLHSRYNVRDMDSLNEALNDSFFYGVRQSALSLCGKLERAAAPFIAGLIQCLRDNKDHDRFGHSFADLEQTVIHTLCRVIGCVDVDQAAKSAAPALVPYLCDERLNQKPPGIRYVIIPALLRLHPDPSTTQGIIEASNMIRKEGRDGNFPSVSTGDGHLTEWLALIHLLGIMEPPSQSAIPFLEEMAAADPDPRAKRVANSAMQSIGKALQQVNS